MWRDSSARAGWRASTAPSRRASTVRSRSRCSNPALAADEKLFERFQIEGINAARLDHANIVPIYEAGEDQGYSFLAMKLIDGESFSSVIARTASLPGDDAVRVLTDVARALDYAHGRGFIHRDVKPANVLIDRAEHVFLSDFGLSKDMGSRGITSTGQWMGTAEYMAPEQAAGRTIDFRADLYALGCVAFECLTGDVAVHGRQRARGDDGPRERRHPGRVLAQPVAAAGGRSRDPARDGEGSGRSLPRRPRVRRLARSGRRRRRAHAERRARGRVQPLRRARTPPSGSRSRRSSGRTHRAGR